MIGSGNVLLWLPVFPSFFLPSFASALLSASPFPSASVAFDQNLLLKKVLFFVFCLILLGHVSISYLKNRISTPYYHWHSTITNILELHTKLIFHWGFSPCNLTTYLPKIFIQYFRKSKINFFENKQINKQKLVQFSNLLPPKWHDCNCSIIFIVNIERFFMIL